MNKRELYMAGLSDFLEDSSVGLQVGQKQIMPRKGQKVKSAGWCLLNQGWKLFFLFHFVSFIAICKLFPGKKKPTAPLSELQHLHPSTVPAESFSGCRRNEVSPLDLYHMCYSPRWVAVPLH